MLVQIAVFGVVLPGAVSLATWAVARQLGGEKSRRVAGAAALFLAVHAASWALFGRPELTPLDVTGWVVHVAGIALVAGVIAALAQREKSLPWIARGAGAIAIAYLILRPLLAHQFTGVAAPLAVVAAAVTLMIYWLCLDQAVSRSTPRAGATVMLVIAAATAAAAGASGTVIVAQLGGAAAAGIGALWLVCLRSPDRELIRGSVPVAAAVGWSVTALATLYAAMSITVAAAVLATPVVAVVANAVVSRRWADSRRARVLVVAATLVAAAAVVAVAVTDGRSLDPAAGADYGYD